MTNFGNSAEVVQAGRNFFSYSHAVRRPQEIEQMVERSSRQLEMSPEPGNGSAGPQEADASGRQADRQVLQLGLAACTAATGVCEKVCVRKCV